MDFLKMLKKRFNVFEDKIPPVRKWCNEIDEFRNAPATEKTYWLIYLKEKEFESFLIQSGLNDIETGFIYTDHAIRIKNDIYYIRQAFNKMRYEIAVKNSDKVSYDRDVRISNQYDKLWREQ